jgi:predicted RNA-binding protein YlxR (DUF448 family)
VPGKPRKHVPLRTCIACGQKRAKRELIRVVRTPAAVIEVDPKGKHPGRGAYLCREHRCWDGALDERKLSRALKCQVSAEDVVDLKEHIALLLEGEAAAGMGVPTTDHVRAQGGPDKPDLDLLQRGSS